MSWPALPTLGPCLRAAAQQCAAGGAAKRTAQRDDAAGGAAKLRRGDATLPSGDAIDELVPCFVAFLIVCRFWVLSFSGRGGSTTPPPSYVRCSFYVAKLARLKVGGGRPPPSPPFRIQG